MTISGDFDTADKEVAIVKRILDAKAIFYQDVKKYANADDGDVEVVLPDGRKVVIEIKEEDYDRFKRFGDLGIDYISVFHFKEGVNESEWKKPRPAIEFPRFKSLIDKTKAYKGGKVFYSKSDLWLFFVLDPDGKFLYCKFFNGKDMTSPQFRNYIESNCQFSANRKSEEQKSCTDKYNSACFFLNNKDATLGKYEVDICEYLAE